MDKISPLKYSTTRYVSKRHLHLGEKPVQGLKEQPIMALHHKSPVLSLEMGGNNCTLRTADGVIHRVVAAQENK